jgi:hypothetical protein
MGMMFQQVVSQKLLGRTHRYFSRDCNHCCGRYLAIGWCDPTTGNEYRGYKTTGPETKEIRHEEIFAVSADPFS